MKHFIWLIAKLFAFQLQLKIKSKHWAEKDGNLESLEL